MRDLATRTLPPLIMMLVLHALFEGCSSHPLRRIQDGGTDTASEGGRSGPDSGGSGGGIGTGGVGGTGGAAAGDRDASTGGGSGSGGNQQRDAGPGQESVYIDGFVDPWTLVPSTGVTVDPGSTSACYRGKACIAASLEGNATITLRRAQPAPVDAALDLQFSIRSVSGTLTGLTLSLVDGTKSCFVAKLSTVTESWMSVGYIIGKACAGATSLSEIHLTNSTAARLDILIDEISFVPG